MISSNLKTIRLEGMGERLRDLGDQAQRIAAETVNEAATFAHDLGRKSMLEEILFPSGYLDSGGRFEVSKRASTENPEARISARGRATSLARFVVGSPRPYARGGVRVKVKRRGGTQTLRTGWVTGLNKGNAGLAVRVAPGGSIPGRRKGVSGLPVLRKDKGGATYLLYGPSVNQVFKGVADDIRPAVSEFMADDFSRRFRRVMQRK